MLQSLSLTGIGSLVRPYDLERSRNYYNKIKRDNMKTLKEEREFYEEELEFFKLLGEEEETFRDYGTNELNREKEEVNCELLTVATANLFSKTLYGQVVTCR